MNFKKDLLLVDLEMTGLDVKRHEIIQLAAVLLDKQTLKEKRSLSFYIKPKYWERRDLESMAVNKITLGQLKKGLSLKAALTKFSKFFNPSQVVISFYGGPMDMDFLRAAYQKAGLKWKFDYHYFNLWAVFYFYLAKANRLTDPHKHAGFTLEGLAKRLKVNLKGARHDALYDCRFEAEILRRIRR